MELIVKIDDVQGDAQYKDGDIVQAFSNERIHMCHAEIICGTNNFPLDTASGLRPNDGLLMKFVEKIHKFKFIRLNENEVKRINLETLAEDVLSEVSSANGERINIYRYLSARLRNPNHKIFGVSGAEIWYGGSRSSNVDDIWNDIETHSDNLKTDHSNWPLTDVEKRHFLPLNCCGHNHEEGEDVELSTGTVVERNMPVYKTEVVGGENAQVLLAKRQWQVPYWDLASELDINVDDVRNRDKILDGRKDVLERPHIDEMNVDKVDAGIIVI